MNLIGKEIDGRYEILEEVGKGGMAHVYKSRDKSLNRIVAVKVLKEDYKDDKEFVRRFNVEAQAAASLSNPHIVSIYDVGCVDGLHYIVMEYVEGETLKEYIDRMKIIPWRQAAEFSIQICEGIEEAHHNSVIHRDIKPQNIIMATDGVLKVTDFGIARASTQATMTMASNNTIGTAHYLSPEQARGGYTDERTDIYSMGVVMYEMLTGKLPFDDNSPVAIAIKHLQETAESITALNPDVPKSFERIVMKAMSKEQDSRYSSVTDMIFDLRKILANPNMDVAEDVSVQKDVSKPVDADASNTVKLPKFNDMDDTGVIDTQGVNNSKYNIDNFNYDDAAAEQEKMERLREKREKRMKKKKDRKVAFVAFLSALAVLAVGFAVSYAVTDGFGIFGLQQDTIEIPDIVGMTIKDAQSKYGDTFSIIEQSSSESTKPVGTILEQTPSGGEKKTNSSNIVIRVIVSSGSSSVTLGDFTGVDYESAVQELEMLGLKYTKIEKVSSDIKEGVIFDQEPKPGSSVAAGDTITLTVSKGPESTPSPTEAAAEPTSIRESVHTATPRPSVPTEAPEDTSSSSGGTGSNGSSGTSSGTSGSSDASGGGTSSSSGGSSYESESGSSSNGVTSDAENGNDNGLTD